MQIIKTAQVNETPFGFRIEYKYLFCCYDSELNRFIGKARGGEILRFSNQDAIDWERNDKDIRTVKQG